MTSLSLLAGKTVNIFPVTLKIRARSPKPNQILIKPQCYIQPNFYSNPPIGSREFLYTRKCHSSVYEGCSNMNASSFITFFTYMLWQNGIPFLKELFVAFKMAPNIKKHLLFFSSYRPLYKSRSSILKFFWSKLQQTFGCTCGYSAISL